MNIKVRYIPFNKFRHDEEYNILRDPEDVIALNFLKKIFGDFSPIEVLRQGEDHDHVTEIEGGEHLYWFKGKLDPIEITPTTATRNTDWKYKVYRGDEEIKKPFLCLSLADDEVAREIAMEYSKSILPRDSLFAFNIQELVRGVRQGIPLEEILFTETMVDSRKMIIVNDIENGNRYWAVPYKIIPSSDPDKPATHLLDMSHLPENFDYEKVEHKFLPSERQDLQKLFHKHGIISDSHLIVPQF